MSMRVNTQAHGLCEGALCDKARYIERGRRSSNLVVGPLAHDAHRLKLCCLSPPNLESSWHVDSLITCMRGGVLTNLLTSYLCSEVANALNK